jgi:CRP/FNR family transcriptional regulator, anaerobic regulatory protein
MIFIRDYFKNTFETSLLNELQKCQVVDMPAGTELRHEEQTVVRYTPLVISGNIRVTRIDESGKEILMYHILPKESCFLNITAALNNNFSNINSLRAITEEATTMVLITDQQIRDWNNLYPSWRDYTARLLNSRFTEFFSIIDNVLFKSVDEKLIGKLNALKDINGEVQATHQEIAFQIGTAREVVSRLLKSLELSGKVELLRGKIKILQPL